MKLIKEFPDKPIFDKAVITIGNFDGMHLGHQAVIKELIDTSHELKIPSVVISFENHPLEVLRPDIPICKICTSEHRMKLMEKMGIDSLVLLNFTQTLSEQSAEQFLMNLHLRQPFSHLVLGWDATLGKNKHGNKEIIQKIAAKHQFAVDYLEQQKVNDAIISSSQIRKLIQEGKLDEVKKFLGRSYSIYSTVYQGEGNGKKLGFPTANFNVKGLCLPPLGVYAVTAKFNTHTIKGVANLGIAPTMRKDKIPVLEVHLFDYHENLYGRSIEVIFSSFLRPEKKFISIEELQNQIQNDIAKAKLVNDEL